MCRINSAWRCVALIGHPQPPCSPIHAHSPHLPLLSAASPHFKVPMESDRLPDLLQAISDSDAKLLGYPVSTCLWKSQGRDVKGLGFCAMTHIPEQLVHLIHSCLTCPPPLPSTAVCQRHDPHPGAAGAPHTLFQVRCSRIPQSAPEVVLRDSTTDNLGYRNLPQK